MKIIVTHFGPDADAICSIWLVKKFFPGFNLAKIIFVPAGTTYKKQTVDGNPDIMHVDTGFGRFDHHQTGDFVCSSKKIFKYLKNNNLLKETEKIVLNRLTDQITQIDHFQQVFWSDPDNDRYDFNLDEILDGLSLIYAGNPVKVVLLGSEIFDAIYKQLQNKVWAEKLIKEEGIIFKTQWGKAIAVNTVNEEVVRLAQKQGFKLVIRKDVNKGYVRIKTWPLKEIDLTGVYNRLVKKDREATWYLHPSKHMLLNGSTKNPEMIPTKLAIKEIIDTVKNQSR
jgi:hypothetical protein